MQFVCSSIDIDAPASVVWAVLQRLAPNGRWSAPRGDTRDPATDVSAVRARDGERPAASGSAVVDNAQFEVHRRHRYLAPGLYTTEHGFRIERLAGGGVRLHQSERIRGLFSGFFGRDKRRATEENFHATNHALKTCSERAQAGLLGETETCGSPAMPADSGSNSPSTA